MPSQLLSDELKLALTKERTRKLGAAGSSGARAVLADASKTVMGYLRTLSGRSVEQIARQTGTLADDLRRAESGGSVFFDTKQKAALQKSFGRSSDDLTRPLTTETKAAALHGFPMPKDDRK